MVGLSRMISLSARGGVSIEAILDQLKSCGVCPSYAVRSATRKDTSKGSCCPVAVGNALKDMHQEIQSIICECKGDSSSNSEGYINTLKEENDSLRKRSQEVYEQHTGSYDPHSGKPWSQVFKEREEQEKGSNLEECPSCHEKTLIHQGGCIGCQSCGYSKCN